MILAKMVLLAIHLNRRYAAFFDIVVGLLLATLVGVATGTEPSCIWLLIGVVGSLWPDLDFVVWVVRRKKIDHLAHQRRDLLHRP